MGTCVSPFEWQCPQKALVAPSKALRQEKKAVLQEFESFRSAFLLAYDDAIHKSLCQVFSPGIVLEPTILGYPQQKRFLYTIKKMLVQCASFKVLPALHGTKERNFKSILGQGFVIPGDGNTMPVQHGLRHGHGIYTANLAAPWLPTKFCDKPRMLVCAVLQTEAVLHAMDAQIVRHRDHIVPLFEASSRSFEHCKSRSRTAFNAPNPPAINVVWLSQLKHVLDCKQHGDTAASLKNMGCPLGLLFFVGYDLGELLSCGFKQEEFANVYHICSLAQLRKICSPIRLTAKHGGSVQSVWSFGKQIFERSSSVAELHEAGFSIIDLLYAGCTAHALQSAGISDTEMLRVQGCRLGKSIAIDDLPHLPLCDLWDSNATLSKLLSVGWAASDLLLAGFSTSDLLRAGCSLQELRSIGCTAHDLLCLRHKMCRRGYRTWLNECSEAKSFKAAGFGLDELKVAGFSQYALKYAGYDARQLRSVGFSLSALVRAYTAEDMEAGGVSVIELNKAKIAPYALRWAGYSAISLAKAGYTVLELIHSGYSCEELKSAGLSEAQDFSDGPGGLFGSFFDDDDDDDDDDWYWPSFDVRFVKESTQVSRYRTLRAALRKSKRDALQQRRQLRCKGERPRSRRKSNDQRLSWSVKRDLESVRHDFACNLLPTTSMID